MDNGEPALPAKDIKEVLDNEIKEWHFRRFIPTILDFYSFDDRSLEDIYFLTQDPKARQAALNLRDAVLHLRKEGAFVAVPLYRVNYGPMGPHPAGSYEIWCPAESFASVFSYLALNRGDLSILVHPLTRDEVLYQLSLHPSKSDFALFQRADHETRRAWLGPSFPIYLDALPVRSAEIPVQYTSLKLGYSSPNPGLTIEERKRAGATIEDILHGEPEAAPAPAD
ncbi:hypothetical protein FRC04_002543 [Tulasnella sp. 424]|nr:hypothetical protein FRC04_002543 [Tulasnella sp. 424]